MAANPLAHWVVVPICLPLVATGALQAGVGCLSCSVAGREHFAGEFL